MLALVLVPALTVACAAAGAWFRLVRDAYFIAMVSLAVVAERMEVNFFSSGWYRGSTRGIQVTLIEILAFGLLFGCVACRSGAARRPFWPASLGLMLLYLVYAGCSVLVSEPKLYGAFELSRIAASMLIFVATAYHVRSRREWTQLVVALACTVGFEGIWAARQHFLNGLDRAAGTLDHANSLSMYFCLTVPVLAAVAVAGWTRGLRVLCGICAVLGAIGLLLTFSRAGIPVFAAASGAALLATVSWRMTPARVIVRALFVAGAAALVVAGWGGMQRRYAEASFEQEYFDTNVDGRGVYLRLSQLIVKDHFFGVGLNNWSYWVSRTYGARLGYRFDDYSNLISVYGTKDDKVFADSYLAAPAHNLAALTLGELGVPGLLIFALLWLRWISIGVPFLFLPRSDPMRAMGIGLLFCICGIFGQSLTEWVYRQTPILFTFYILLGALASMAHLRRQEQARRAPGPATAPEPHTLGGHSVAPEGA